MSCKAWQIYHSLQPEYLLVEGKTEAQPPLAATPPENQYGRMTADDSAVTQKDETKRYEHTILSLFIFFLNDRRNAKFCVRRKQRKEEVLCQKWFSRNYFHAAGQQRSGDAGSFASSLCAAAWTSINQSATELPPAGHHDAWIEDPLFARRIASAAGSDLTLPAFSGNLAAFLLTNYSIETDQLLGLFQTRETAETL